MRKFLVIFSMILLAGCDALEYQIALDGMCDDTIDQGRIICKCVQHTLEQVEPSAEFQRTFVALMDGNMLGVDEDMAEEVRQTVAQLYMVCASKSMGY